MFQKILEKDLKQISSRIAGNSTEVKVSIPEDPKFGDYTSNIALQLAKHKDQNVYHSPIEIANILTGELSKLAYVEKAEVAGPGFVNIFLKDNLLNLIAIFLLFKTFLLK